MKGRTLHREQGFSLIELLVALAVFAIVLTGVVKMFTSTGHYHTSQEIIVDLTQNVRAAKHLMVYDIRSAGCNPKDLIRFGFQLDADDRRNTDANSIRFTSDVDDNVQTDQVLKPNGALDAGETVGYYRTDNNGNLLLPGNTTAGLLVREVDGVAQVVMDNVTNLQFLYFDQNNAQVTNFTTTTNLDAIRTVQVTLTGQVMNTKAVSSGNRTWTQQFTIKVRNAGI